MKTIHVRSEESGDYTRLTWVCPFTQKRKRVSIGLTKELSRKQIKDAIVEKATELNNDPALAAMGRMTIAQWRARFESIAVMKETSLDQIGWTFDKLEEFFGADKLMPKIGAADARDFVQWLEKQTYRDKPLRTATVRKHVRNCKSIWARAVVEKAKSGVPENAFLLEKSSGVRVRKEWEELSDEKMEKILDACPSVGWKAMFALCRWGGLRQQQAYRLEWGDVHWDDPARLRVVLEATEEGTLADPDTKNRERIVPIEARLYTVLRLAFEQGSPEGPCRDLPGSGSRISQVAQQIIRRAGVPYHKPLHTGRKNRQTEWEKVIGREATCEFLGNSPEVADKHYIAPATMDDLRKLSVQIAPKTAPN
jgi:integrase